MTHAVEPSPQCPFHRAYECVQRSNIARCAAALPIVSLKFLRDCIDRRLARLDAGAPPPDKVRIPVKEE